MDSTVCISSEKYWTSKIRNWPSHPVLSKTNAQRLSAAGSTKTYVGALGQPWRYLGPVEAWVVNFAMGTVEPSPSKWPNFVAYNWGGDPITTYDTWDDPPKYVSPARN